MSFFGKTVWGVFGALLLVGSLCAEEPTGTGTPIRPEKTLPPGVVIDQSDDFANHFVGSPSMEILPDGTYVATHDWFGKRKGRKDWKVTPVFQSGDQGKTWKQVGKIDGLQHGILFAVGQKLYCIGLSHEDLPDMRESCILICRSDDAGRTWTVPKDAQSGLLLSDRAYFVDPGPVLLYKGRVWKEVEAVGPKETCSPQGTMRNWATGYQPICASAPQDADLLDASNWTFSNPVPWTPQRGLGGWLEGNVLFTPEGKMILQQRVDNSADGGMAAQIQLSDDGRTATFDPQTGFVSMPGGCKKFIIKYDEVSKKYWSLVNWVHPDDRQQTDKERVRNTLALVCSSDLKHWEIRNVVLRHAWTKIGFQYVDWRIVGEDLHFVCRLAWEGARNCHDANYLTFHVLKNFRTLTRENDAPTFPRPE